MLRLKKLFAVLLLGAVLFTGCSIYSGEQKAAEQIGTPFTSQAKFTYRGVSACMDIVSEPERSYTLTFTEPASMQDMKMVFTKEQVEFEYKGMQFAVKPEQISDGAVGRLLMDSIEAAAGKENITLNSAEGVITVRSRIDSGEFLLKLDEKTGNFLSLALPEQEFYLEFSDFSFY